MCRTVKDVTECSERWTPWPFVAVSEDRYLNYLPSVGQLSVFSRQPATKRLEFRTPDAACNPYLAFSAMLMAGIDGVKKKIDPRAAGFGPIDVNVFTWNEAQRRYWESRRAERRR